MIEEVFPVLYTLMRTDIPSMNPGKGMIQAQHAGHAFLHELPDLPKGSPKNREQVQLDLVELWKIESKQGFGTGLSIGVTEEQMRTSVEVAKILGFFANVVTDDTYPYQTTAEIARLIDPVRHTKEPVFNGEHATCFRSEDTCAYVFGDKNDPMMAAFLGRFQLHP